MLWVEPVRGQTSCRCFELSLFQVVIASRLALGFYPRLKCWNQMLESSFDAYGLNLRIVLVDWRGIYPCIFLTSHGSNGH